MAADPNCIFCRIAAGTIPAARVWESPWALAFLDIAPVAAGHTLLVLKDHFQDIGQVPPSILAAALGRLPTLARAVLSVTGADGLNVLQNNGRAAGQVVEHVHFHLIPRRANDEFRFAWPKHAYGPEEMEQLRVRIAAAIT